MRNLHKNQGSTKFRKTTGKILHLSNTITILIKYFSTRCQSAPGGSIRTYLCVANHSDQGWAVRRRELEERGRIQYWLYQEDARLVRKYSEAGRLKILE